MARLPRLDLPHVLYRSTSCSAATTVSPFSFTKMIMAFTLNICEALVKNNCRLYAIVLMTNHVHLLALGETSSGVSSLMQSVGRRYVRYVNGLYRRTGTLFEGRFKSSLVDSKC